ncbi:MAG: hypothetical protein AAFX87_11290 [Bacteroidota bacterium]
MTLVDFIRLFFLNLKILVGVAVTLVVTILALTKDPPKTYTSRTTIYTGLASGYTIEGSNKADYFNTAMAFDNLLNIIKGRETREEVAIRLLASHLLMNEHNPSEMSWASYQGLSTLLNDTLSQVLISDGDYEKVVNAIRAYKSKDDSNEIFSLLNSKHKYYSIDAISKASVSRVDNSDLIKAEYTSEDQAICQYTLELLTQVFIRRYRELKEAQTGTVVAYFIEQTNQAQDRLSAAEDELLKFRKDNNIINYYEQTRFISAEKEKLGKDYSEKEMVLAAAQATIQGVEEKLGDKRQLALNSKDIIEKRNEISQLTSRIAENEITGADSLGVSSPDIRRLKRQADQTKNALQSKVYSLYADNNSARGIPTKELLDRWIESVILLDESLAELRVLQGRKNEFDRLYKKMAPLGAQLKRIEREIEVAEEEYLSLLQSLNLSKLRQQNIELSTKLKVIDPPFYPTKTKGSPRVMLAAIGGFGGFVFTLGVIIAMEFLDSTVKYPARAEEQTKLTLAGVFPKIPRKPRRINYDLIYKRLIEQIVHQVRLISLERHATPLLTAVLSTRDGEGKSLLTQKIVENVRSLNKRTLYLRPDSETETDEEWLEEHKDNRLFGLANGFLELSNMNDLLKKYRLRLESFAFIFMELPPILHRPYPIELMRHMHHSLLVVRSNRVWNKADKSTMQTYQQIVTHEPQIILNGVKVESLESIIGEIPKKRSWLRMTVKRWAKFEFRSRRNF